MTGRERVLAALAHEEPDRVPIDLGSALATTINVVAYDKLKAFLGIKTPSKVASLRSMIATVDDAILERYGVDTRGLPLTANSRPVSQLADGSFQDEWGVVRRQADPQSHFLDVGNPLADAQSPEELERFSWPDPDDPGYTAGLAQDAERLHRRTDCAIVLSLPVGPLHQTQWLRGYEKWMLDLAANPEFYQALMERVTDLWLATSRRLLDAVGSNADVLFFGDDVAYQDGPMVSRRAYEKCIKPYHEKIFALLRSHGGKIVYHSCGSVVSLLEDFIDMGVDALNPVQVSANGMDTARLKRDFGDRIAFWGGVDTQRVLPFGSPDEVRREVQNRIRDLAAGGGYVLGAVHNIQKEVPPENIDAMFTEALRAGRYPLGKPAYLS